MDSTHGMSTSTPPSSTTTSASTAPPPPTSVLFARGVLARLAYWPALRIAVDHGWGGPESAAKRTWLASVLVDDFEDQQGQVDADYVEDRLLQVMADEFETVLEDCSAEAVARDLVRLWAEVGAGGMKLLQEFEERADRVKGKTVQAEEAAGDESDWEDESGEEDEDEHAPQLLDQQPRPPREEPEVDADGFVTVKSKGKSHR
ncbi:Pre-rRNA-processing protein TSR2-domain-containing protein [Trametes elegans]|nr:Pre-rRNA-processing protein TSR2-domain-containing protein [Trametes elegans]KAI0759733.1 Pre-rRNA-processing protein TSR2-domain-containing protein [Trametes elegans]